MCFTTEPTLEKEKAIRKLDFVGRDAPAGARLGWRAWKVTGTDKLQLVSPIISGKPWPSGQPMSGDPITAREGVYAIAELKHLKRLYKHELGDKRTVIGLVAIWGNIAVHGDEGFRGEYAYPVRLWVNDYLLEVRLRDLYQCSVKRLPARLLYEDALKAA